MPVQRVPASFDKARESWKFHANSVLSPDTNARVYKANPPAINYKKYVELQTEAQKNNLGMWNNNLCN